MLSNLKNIFNLKDKVVIITGASGLLGQKHAEVIAAYGGNPVLIDLNINLVNQQAKQLSLKYGVDAIGYSVDITNEEQIQSNLKLIIKHYKKIDALINNAANNPKIEESNEKNFSRLENFRLDDWYKDINVGLTGAFLCAKYYGTKISENPSGGVIINISSDLGLIAPDQRLYKTTNLADDMQPVKPVTYSVVKTGIIGLTRYLSTYWTDANVRCNAICPGGVENGQSDNFLKEVSLRIPLNRLAKSDEYQSTLIWMLSDASSYLNGSIVSVDGGRTVL
jgi:NAD(P)-dependent dehydrogenase (short-subunit alcohol dehydrogenase family)